VIEEPTELVDGGPTACPFIAFEADRDHRSNKPDYNHRCFAAPEPEPRAFPHQERYCLSANFARCPIFLDWAKQEAAAVKVAAAAAAAEGVAAAVATDGDLAPAFLAARTANAAAAADVKTPPRRSADASAGLWSYDGEGKRTQAPSAPTPPSSLGAPAVAVARRGPSHPGWENPPRLESFPRLRSRQDHRANQPLLMAAVGLTIFMVALILFPIVMQNKGGGAGATQTPGGSGPVASTAVSSPSAGPSSERTFFQYTIKSGDQLWAIAKYFNITLANLEAANPQIKDPSQIQAGDKLNIPPIGWSPSATPS
jgi:nucleoid-associated protein YgaU